MHRRNTLELGRDPLLIGAAACIVAAFAARAGAALRTGELSLDEASTFFVAARPLREVLTVPVSFHAQPPLYYLALHQWLRAGDAEPWLRLLSVLLMLGAAGTLLAASWLSPLARVITVGVLLLSDYGLYLAGFIRPYALVTWLALGSTLLFYSLLAQGPRRARTHAAYAAVTLLMAYSLSMASGLLLAEGVCLVAAFALAWCRRGIADAWRQHGGLLVSLAVVALVYLPYLVAVSGQHAQIGHPSIGGSLRAAFNPRYFVSGPLYLLAMPVRLGLIAAAAALYAAWTGGRRRDALVGVLLAMVAIQIAMMHGFLEGRSPFAFRYLAPAYPAACLLAGIGAARWLERTGRAREVVAACAVAALAASVTAALTRRPIPEGSWRQVRRDLSAMQGTKIVFFEVGWNSQPFQYEMRGDPAVHVMANPGAGWGSGGQNMTPEFVGAVVAREARAPVTFLYDVDTSAPGTVFDAAFVPAMTRLGCTRMYDRAVQGRPERFVGYACHGE